MEMTDAEKYIYDKFSDIVGMHNVQSKLCKILGSLSTRPNFGLTDMNFSITGNHGTGKLTVAYILADILKEQGILKSDGGFVEVDAYELTCGLNSEFVLQRIKSAVSCALDGVLYIRDAYKLLTSCASGSIDFIKKNLSKFILIISGPLDETTSFIKETFDVFPTEYKINIRDYTVPELKAIGMKMAEKRGFKLSDEAEEAFETELRKSVCINPRMYENAKTVSVLIDRYIRIQAARIYIKGDDYENNVIIKEDVTGENMVYMSISDHQLLPIADLVGLSRQKEIITELCYGIYTEKHRSINQHTDISNRLNFIFDGRKGTGKSTVAYVIAQVLNNIGVLWNGDVVECNWSDLYAECENEANEKVNNIFSMAGEKVLLINDVYMIESMANNYTQTALFNSINNSKGKTVVILAGEEISQSIIHNPKFEFYFPERLRISFPEYTINELCEIGKSLLQDSNIALENDKENLFDAEIERLTVNDPNANIVKNYVDLIIKRHMARISHGDKNLFAKDSDVRYNILNDNFDIDRLLDSLNCPQSVKDDLRKIYNFLYVYGHLGKFGLKREPLILKFVFSGGSAPQRESTANILAKVFKETGVLPTDMVLEVAYTTFKAKTDVDKILNQAFGGTLLVNIDENPFNDRINYLMNQECYCTAIILSGSQDAINDALKHTSIKRTDIINKLIIEFDL